LKRGGDRRSEDFKASDDALKNGSNQHKKVEASRDASSNNLVTEEQASRIVGSSRATIQRAKAIIKKGIPELNKAFAGLQAKKFYQEEARKRQLSNLSHVKDSVVRLTSDEREKGDTLAKASKQVGVSKDAVWKASIIERDGIPEVITS